MKRVIHKATGIVYFRADHIADDKKLMASYGFELQEVEPVKPIEIIQAEEPENTTQEVDVIITDYPEIEQQQEVKVKRTRKKRK